MDQVEAITPQQEKVLVAEGRPLGRTAGGERGRSERGAHKVSNPLTATRHIRVSRVHQERLEDD
jgi:hypothetical protein